MDEDEAALLAELRAISNQSAASRFDDTNDNAKNISNGESLDNPMTAAVEEPSAVQAPLVDDNNDTSASTSHTTSTKGFSTTDKDVPTTEEPASSSPMPPWKRGRPKVKESSHEQSQVPDIDIVVAAPPKKTSPPPIEPAPRNAPTVADSDRQTGFQSDAPVSSFEGERGGTAEDAELLALLRGVSAKSASASRFADQDTADGIMEEIDPAPVPLDKNTILASKEEIPITSEAKAPPTPKDDKASPLPPWKRGRGSVRKDAQQSEAGAEISVVVAAPPRPKLDDMNEASNNVQFQEKAAASEQKGEALLISEPQSLGIKSDTTSTFVGERGGAAEDAELLALLRGVSAKSSSASRFADNDEVLSIEQDAPSGSATVVQPESSKPPAMNDQPKSPGHKGKNYGNEDQLPPWKRGRASLKKKDPELDVMVVAAPPPKSDVTNTVKEPPVEPDPVQEKPLEPSYGIKSDVPSTFTGERGGAAEDAELLALLRGVSAKSASSRFGDESGQNGASQESPPITIPEDTSSQPVSISSVPDSKNQSDDSQLPPWKRGSRSNAKTLQENSVDIVVAAPPPKKELPESSSEPVVASASNEPAYGIKSDIPSTFVGERGGAAEDAELLALLRGVSAKASAARFEDNVEVVESTVRESVPEAVTRSPTLQVSVTPVTPSNTASSDEIVVERSDLPSALTDKNWKVRGRAYELVTTILQEKVGGREDVWDIEGNSIVDGLDDLIPTLVADSNVSALDRALEFCLLYAEHCRAAANSEKASIIVTSLLKKNGLSSRPTTVKAAASLVLKLMEVGTDGLASVHAIVDALLHEGLSSKKPKVVQNSVATILDAAQEFGAAKLPLVSIISSAPRMLSHQNAGVRNLSIKIIAEIVRALGSKQPIQEVIDGMKKAQVSELDDLLSNQPAPTDPKRRLRSEQHLPTGSGGEDAVAALAAGAKELEAQRFAARPAVDLIAALSKTDFSSRLQLSKWSEKVGALNTALECGGERPYKLAQPSPSVNYAPLIVDLKKLLGHTHFAVCSKAMDVLCMLSQGVGEKLFPYLRPLLRILLKLSKDKKLTKSVGECLDSFFGNVVGFEHLLDNDDAIPSAVDERSEKNALARTAALESLSRCVARGCNAGPRGHLSETMASRIASLCVDKLGDSNASVRKAAMDVLVSLKESEDEGVGDVGIRAIEALKDKNPRAYKAMTTGESRGQKQSTPIRPHSSPRVLPPAVPESKEAELQRKSKAEKAYVVTRAPGQEADTAMSSDELLSLDAAVQHASGLRIPQWDAPEDDGGILSGIQSSKWMYRQDSIKSMTAFVESGHLKSSSTIETDASSLLVIVREHTRGFKETNVNIMKAILQLFLSMCDLFESMEKRFLPWAMKAGVEVAIQKISDRKLSSASKGLLTSLCVVSIPKEVLIAGFSTLKGVKSPVAHEEYMRWLLTFCDEFGMASAGNGLPDILPPLLEETKHSNVKVKKEALHVLGVMHTQLGPQFKALALSMAKAEEKASIETTFDDHEYDEAFQTYQWARESLFAGGVGAGADVPDGGLVFEVPRSDLYSELGEECLLRLSSKEGKASWKIRKSALEEVESALKRCSGLIDSSGPRQKFLIDLSRALRDRLSDTQINLKPIAARLIGTLLSSVDGSSQAKLGRLFFGPLINATMNDIKKPMRDASLEAIRQGTSLAPLEGQGLNKEALEAFVVAFVGEVTEASSRAGGLPDVLHFLLSITESLPNLDDIASSRGATVGEKYSVALVECMTSSKSETRSASTQILEISIDKGIVGMESVRKATSRLKPAKQRSVAPIVAKLAKQQSQPEQGKENDKPDIAAAAPQTSQKQISRDSPRRASRQSTAASPISGKDGVTRHPLIARGARHTNHSAGGRSIIWPEYPEEPHGLPLLENLKKAWSPLLPVSTANLLFPVNGIRKQDDAQSGCEILSQSIAMDREDGGDSTEKNLDYILKWIVFTLCSKENTVGLQIILTLLLDLLNFLAEHKRELSEHEAMSILPFLLEKASTAKGRFRDMFMQAVSTSQSVDLISTKVFGSSICTAVMERSSHAKARVLSCHISAECVEKDGLSGIGKKGVLAAAKLLSEETIPENRAAALDLMELILSKMNGDIQRLARICGQNLSDKAQQLIKERWAKKDNREDGAPVSSRKTRLHENHLAASKDIRSPVDIHDQLPALSLRDEGYEPKKVGVSDVNFANEESAFSFSLPAATATNGTNEQSASSTSEEVRSGAGSAAALRARLMKIREKSKASSPESGKEGSNRDQVQESVFDDGISQMKKILSVEPPFEEDDPLLLNCIDVLKKFHAGLSKQQHAAAGLSVAELSLLREAIAGHMTATLECLTRLIGLAFDCGDPNQNAGMSIPLLSVCLATLMALFRDPELASLVSQDDLTILIREAGTALLDARLGATSQLDQTTASQMVRAINKLAVQAATGASRSVAFQSLMTLQIQLSFGDPKSHDDAMFNSRLARVMSKLFSRLIKAEEASSTPFSSHGIDMESILCSLEDFANACEQAKDKVGSNATEPVITCTDMIKSLLESILQVHSASVIFKMMDELEIDRNTSGIGMILNSLSGMENVHQDDGGQLDSRTAPAASSPESGRVSSPTKVPNIGVPAIHFSSKDVATLVSAVATASHGSERESALDALREYTSANGNDELDEHLQQVSAPFRAFIQEELGASDIRTKLLDQPDASSAGSVSARLRQLRSRLEATEMSVQAAIKEKPEPSFESANEDSHPSPRERESPSKSPVPVRRQSRLSRPSPSKLVAPSPSISSQALRERLAAAQDIRPTGSSESATSNSSNSTAGRAAALRARLEAVKQKNQAQL